MDIVVRELVRHTTVNTLCALACACKDTYSLISPSEVVYVLCKRFDLTAPSFSEFMKTYDNNVYDRERRTTKSINQCIVSAVDRDSVACMRITLESIQLDPEAYDVIMTYAARQHSVRVFEYMLSLIGECLDGNSSFELTSIAATVTYMPTETVVLLCDTIANDSILMSMWELPECELDSVYVQCVVLGDMTRYEELVTCHLLLEYKHIDTNTAIIRGVMVSGDIALTRKCMDMGLITVRGAYEYLNDDVYWDREVMHYITGEVTYEEVLDDSWSNTDALNDVYNLVL